MFVANNASINGKLQNDQDVERSISRSIDELISLSKGLLADGRLNDEEIRYLDEWLKTNQQCLQRWPGNAIFDRVARVLEDSIIEEQERTDLFDILRQTIGLSESKVAFEAIPWQDSKIMVEFTGRHFCFTGRFAFGARAIITSATEKAGGLCSNVLNEHIDFLVVGSLSTHEWLNSSSGAKLQRAQKLKEANCKIAIVSEYYWYESLKFTLFEQGLGRNRV